MRIGQIVRARVPLSPIPYPLSPILHPLFCSVTDIADRLQAALGSAYRIERELGGGGMSHVFLATELGLKRQVVIKVLPPELTSDVMTARLHANWK